MGEFELIRNFFAAAPVRRAAKACPGDRRRLRLAGCSPGEQLAISTDTLVAGVHFADPAIRFCSVSARWPWRSVTWPPWAPPPLPLPLP
jgi:thiamine monophosphate kinase